MQKEFKEGYSIHRKCPFVLSLQVMKHCLYIIIVFFISAHTLYGQREGRTPRSGFSLGNLRGNQQEVPDSLLVPDSTLYSNKRITAFHLTDKLGDRYIAPMDTGELNTGNRTLMEGRGLGIGYLANLGSPVHNRIFSEQKEARDFIFADPFDYIITTPTNAYFYDTKIPITEVLYTTAGASLNKEQQLKAMMAMNFNKHINVGGDLDYIYSRGYYKQNGNKMFSYRLFGSYRTDKYEANAYIRNFNFVMHENNGLENDSTITYPDEYFTGTRKEYSKDFNINYKNDAFNRVRGKQFFLIHRYNLGFTRELDEVDENDIPLEVFIPVSSIIHTVDYEDNRRRFYSPNGVDDNYTFINEFGEVIPRIYGVDSYTDDRTSYWNLKNTVTLSLREGFQDWAKFGITAFATFEKRRFQLPGAVEGLDYNDERGTYYKQEEADITIFDFPKPDIYDEFSTFIGAEISKRQGSLITYNARGELCIVGADLGELRLEGKLKTIFNLFKKPTTIRTFGFFRNTTPAFYYRHNHSRYFWWDNYSLKNIQQLSLNGEIDIKLTGTKLMAGVESIQNYVYLNNKGIPEQHGSNLQVITARIRQDFRFRAFGWENEVAYQLSSDKEIIPLPQITAYSNMYLAFKLAKVLTIQMGTDLHYFTSYYAPWYEPATLQFHTQNEVKVGNYPLMNAYVNFHLKQARFFVMGYNVSSQFVKPNHFAFPHYPLNPMILKMGVAVTFNN